LSTGGGSRAPRGAFAVGAGILCSRVAGLLRGSLLGAWLGVGPHADVLSAALRLPNLIQNLLGEQTLSAAFIPIYSRLLGEGRRRDAGRFAGAIFALLAACAGGLALVGVLLARPLVAIFAAGFLRDRELVAQGLATVDRFPLAVAAVQWIFPMTALLVLSAWALGVLNSHGRFFLSYVAPVFWNGAIVAAVAWIGWTTPGEVSAERLLRAACIGAFVGGALQFLVQLPGVIREVEGWSFGFRLGEAPVREALAAFLPTVAGRGVVQLSSYVDQILASLLAAGAISAIGYAQTLYLLPISLFGMSFAAAALPELARRRGSGESVEVARHLRGAVLRTAWLNLPGTVAYLLLGLPLVGGLFRLFGGRFGDGEIWLVFLTLAAYSLGLPAATEGRVLQTTLYSHGETRAPARLAAARVAIALALGAPLMLVLDRWSVDGARSLAGVTFAPGSGTALRLGAVGLALAASVAAWFERYALLAAVRKRVPDFDPPRAESLRYGLAALAAAAIPFALLVAGVGESWHPTIRAALLLLLFGAGYFALTRREEPAAELFARRSRGGSERA
jgi:putative peptidoglycan lipid II flippase